MPDAASTRAVTRNPRGRSAVNSYQQQWHERYPPSDALSGSQTILETNETDRKTSTALGLTLVLHTSLGLCGVDKRRRQSHTISRRNERPLLVQQSGGNRDAQLTTVTLTIHMLVGSTEDTAAFCQTHAQQMNNRTSKIGARVVMARDMA
ncbi:hypothetical protein MRX96_004011 [Rhipicephalus microplus]